MSKIMRQELCSQFARRCAILLWICASSLPSFAQEIQDSTEHVLTLEIGPAFERDVGGNASSSGGMVGFEVTPIDDILEIEASGSWLNENGYKVAEGEVIFKKPYPMTATSEFMIGIGPEFDRRTQGPSPGTTSSVALALDFMFWPTKKVGWFFSPEYQYGVGQNKGNRTIGISAGILFGF